MDNHENTQEPVTLTRHDILCLAVSFHTVAHCGCTCDVRFRLTHCDDGHAHVDTLHDDTCPVVRKMAAPFN